MARKKGKLVFSTKTGDRKKQAKPRSLPPNQQTLKIMRSKKGRRGKTVTVISGFVLTPSDLAALAKTLKTLCGAGGTVKDGGIELQGDHRHKVAERLRALGYQVKLAGG
ncbi:MAG: translation initiation factor [Anaerolineae bacterium]